MSEYKHPASGRIYHEGDPSHRFAVLVAALARQCDEFLRHYHERLDGHDYLEQHTTWQSDPGRIARAMTDTLDRIDTAYTDLIVDRDAYRYGLGTQDDDWQRKYAQQPPAND